MRASLLLSLSIMLLLGCASERALRFQTPAVADLVGGYFGTRHQIYLTLKQDGTYGAGLGDCGGSDGVSEGAWQIAAHQVHFFPATETKKIKGLLSTAAIARSGNQWVLVIPEDQQSFKARGASYETCFKNTGR